MSLQCGKLSRLGVVASSHRGCRRRRRLLAIEPPRPAPQNGTMIVLTATPSSNDLKTAIHPCDIQSLVGSASAYALRRAYADAEPAQQPQYRAQNQRRARYLSSLSREQSQRNTHVYADQIRVHVCAFYSKATCTCVRLKLPGIVHDVPLPPSTLPSHHGWLYALRLCALRLYALRL